MWSCVVHICCQSHHSGQCQLALISCKSRPHCPSSTDNGGLPQGSTLTSQHWHWGTTSRIEYTGHPALTLRDNLKDQIDWPPSTDIEGQPQGSIILVTQHWLWRTTSMINHTGKPALTLRDYLKDQLTGQPALTLKEYLKDQPYWPPSTDSEGLHQGSTILASQHWLWGTTSRINCSGPPALTLRDYLKDQL